MPESEYQAGFGVIISGQNPQTFMIPIYSTTVLYDYVISFLRTKATKLAFVAKGLSDISKILKLIAELPSARQVILTH